MVSQIEYDVYKFLLENKQDIINDLNDDVNELLGKEHWFKGYFRKAFDKAYYDLIEGHVRNEIMNIFGLNYLQASDILYGEKFQDLLSDFLRRENYVKTNWIC